MNHGVVCSEETSGGRVNDVVVVRWEKKSGGN